MLEDSSAVRHRDGGRRRFQANRRHQAEGRQQAEVKREGERVGLRSATAPTTYWSDAPDEKPHRDPAYLPAYNPRRVSGASYRPYAGDSEWTLAANAAMKVAANANYPI